MKLFLIDGHALVFKMYYAFLGRPMINSKGTDTSILFGFTKYLLELLEREKPTHVAVSFDPPGGTFRNELYPEYKGTRPPTPQLVIDALEPLTKIVRALNIPVLMIPGFEADDVIGSMAKRSAAEGFDVFMVTPDKDYGQLIGEHIFQYKPGKGGENEVIDIPKLCAKYGIDRPEQIIDMLTICGDVSDNVPGVKGVGEKGAAKLLKQYGTVENIYAHIQELTPRQQGMFEEARDHIALSRTLVTIKTDIPLETTAEDMALDTSYGPEIMELFNFYEFNSLKKHLRGKTLSDLPVGELPADAVKTAPAKVADYAIILDGETLYVTDGNGVEKGRPEEFRALLEDGGKSKAGYGIKAQMNALAKEGIRLEGRLLDCEIMHYLLNPESSHKLESLVRGYLGIELGESSLGTGSLFDEVEARDRSDECRALRSLADMLYAELVNAGMARLYDEIEEPLISVLSGMELTGVKIDLASMQDFAQELRKSMLAREAEVRDLAGEPSLNISSPKQIGEVIFEKLKLDPMARKPKKGSWPTDEETLSALADRSPIIDAILDYRGLRKLLNTYIEPFADYISPLDGRVHTTFNQALTSTGRLSSSNPNLQNIPIRTEQGREIRKAFVAGNPGWVMMSADYSQIELRVMAHLSGDEHLCKAFREGQDVHAATASKIFGVPVEEVTSDQRRMAKTANFGIMYGISSFGLAQRLKTSRKEAKDLIDGYFANFPAVRSFIDGTLAQARADKYTETIFGRRRYIPDIDSHNANLRAFAERNAVNAPIQGTAADIIKIAMIRVAACLREEALQSRMVLQIHDELLLEVPEDEIEKVREILVREMENVIKLNVPLTVECNYGKTWLDAH